MLSSILITMIGLLRKDVPSLPERHQMDQVENSLDKTAEFFTPEEDEVLDTLLKARISDNSSTVEQAPYSSRAVFKTFSVSRPKQQAQPETLSPRHLMTLKSSRKLQEESKIFKANPTVSTDDKSNSDQDKSIVENNTQPAFKIRRNFSGARLNVKNSELLDIKQDLIQQSRNLAYHRNAQRTGRNLNTTETFKPDACLYSPQAKYAFTPLSERDCGKKEEFPAFKFDSDTDSLKKKIEVAKSFPPLNGQSLSVIKIQRHPFVCKRLGKYQLGVVSRLFSEK